MSPDGTYPAEPVIERRQGRRRCFPRFDAGEMLRWASCGLLAGAVGMLLFEMPRMLGENGGFWPAEPVSAGISEPFVPPAVTTSSPLRQATDPRDFVVSDQEALRRPLAFSLEPGGTLNAEGSIDQGSAARLEAELDALGSQVHTISLNSPGGSLDDAIRMAELIRERGIATRVKDGAICASSCPLLMAGGVTREAGLKAAVAVHQFYAAGEPSADPAQAMADAQTTTARISRHLTAMGIDPAVWLHALDTPPRELYYLTPQELADYRMVSATRAVAQR